MKKYSGYRQDLDGDLDNVKQLAKSNPNEYLAKGFHNEDNFKEITYDLANDLLDDGSVGVFIHYQLGKMFKDLEKKAAEVAAVKRPDLYFLAGFHKDPENKEVTKNAVNKCAAEDPEYFFKARLYDICPECVKENEDKLRGFALNVLDKNPNYFIKLELYKFFPNESKEIISNMVQSSPFEYYTKGLWKVFSEYEPMVIKKIVDGYNNRNYNASELVVLFSFGAFKRHPELCKDVAKKYVRDYKKDDKLYGISEFYKQMSDSVGKSLNNLAYRLKMFGFTKEALYVNRILFKK